MVRPTARIDRRRFLGYTALAAGALAVPTACGSPRQQQGSSGGSGPLRVVLPTDPESLDPNGTSTGTDTSIIDNVVDSLLRAGQGADLMPWIATKWKPVGDDRWEFQIRDGVKFSDGTPLKAEDIAWSIEQARKKSPLASMIGTITKAKPKDDGTMVIHTSEPTAELPLTVVSIPAMLNHAWVDKAGGISDELLGTGCAELVSWDPGRQIKLKKNKGFWGDPIDWDEVTFTSSLDQGTRGNAARVGEADIIFRISPRDVAAIDKAGKMRVVSSASSRCAHIRVTDTHGPLENKLVRQALNYAVDIPAIMKSVFLGHGTPTGGQMQGDFSTGYHKSIKPFPHDPEKAKSLLRQAGYPKGISVVMGTPQGRYPNDFEYCQALVGQLKDAGIEVDLKVREAGDYDAMISGQKEADPLIFWSTGNVVPTGQNSYRDLLESHQDRTFLMHSDALWAVYRKLIKEFDAKERRKLSLQANEIVRDHCPVIFGYAEVALTAESPRVKWTPPIFSDRMALHAVKRA